MKKAQALITLIIFVTIAMLIISATVTMIAVNSEAASTVQQSLLVREAAENGIENALLRLLRDPSYGQTGCEILSASINGYSTEICVTGDEINKTIVSTATADNFQRKIKVKITYNENVMRVIFWQDIL
ncbi:MAG: hypothetical protein V1858_00430 [Candidatus Gottesmanbacteria bacterium]